jgi:hypothetical protein
MPAGALLNLANAKEAALFSAAFFLSIGLIATGDSGCFQV